MTSCALRVRGPRFIAGPSLKKRGARLPPLDIGGPWLVMAQILNGEGIVAVEHLQAGTALLRDSLRILDALDAAR
jgi:hypothetical protein